MRPGSTCCIISLLFCQIHVSHSKLSNTAAQQRQKSLRVGVTEDSGSSPTAASGNRTRTGSSGYTGATVDLASINNARNEHLRDQYRYSIQSAVARMETYKYLLVGRAAAESSVSRPILDIPDSPDRMLIQPKYIPSNISPFVAAGTKGRAWQENFAGHYLLLEGPVSPVRGFMLGRILLRRLGKEAIAKLSVNISMVDSYYTYVPYRYRYSFEKNSDTPSNSKNNATDSMPDTWFMDFIKIVTFNWTVLNDNAVSTDVCYLERWNKELPFTELPHMLLTFLANDSLTGSTMEKKLEFFTAFLDQSETAYPIKDNRSKVFDIAPKYNKYTAKCPAPMDTSDAAININSAISSNLTNAPTWYSNVLVQWNTMVQNGDRSICGVGGIQKPSGCKKPAQSNNLDPFFTGVDQLRKLYTDRKSYSRKQLLEGVTTAAKHCYNETLFPSSIGLFPCLDFALGSGQVRNLSWAKSLFGNEELCQRFLAPDLDKCPEVGECTHHDIITMNVFSRNFFLCPEPVDETMIVRLTRTNLSKTNTSLDLSPTSTGNSLKVKRKKGSLSHRLISLLLSPFFLFSARSCLPLLSSP